jgi:hypothetical protein
MKISCGVAVYDDEGGFSKAREKVRSSASINASTTIPIRFPTHSSGKEHV